MSYGKRIAAARTAIGMSQMQLGAEINATQQAIAAWEVGRNEPKLVVFERLAKILKTTPQWLAFGVGEAPEGVNYTNE